MRSSDDPRRPGFRRTTGPCGQGGGDCLCRLCQCREQIVPHLQNRREARFEIPGPDQVRFMRRVAEADQNRREPAVDEYEPAVAIAAIGKNLDRLERNFRLHNP